MESVKADFAFVGVVVGAITGIMALDKTYPELKKRLAEERAEKATAPQTPLVLAQESHLLRPSCAIILDRAPNGPGVPGWATVARLS